MNQLHRESTEVKFNVPWGHIAGKVYGSSSESKVLLVHGILDNAGSFDRLIELLPHQYQYVSIDLPGHGLSSSFPPGVPLHFFDYVYSILAVLDALKWKTCMYIAHSFGAHLGTYLSILYPGRLEKIVAIDGIISLPIEDIVSYIQQMYNLDFYTKDSGKLNTKDEVMYALQFKRQEALKADAAEALFKRAVTKVNDLYKYNRDVRLRYIPKPIYKLEQHIEIFRKFTTPILVIVSGNSGKSKEFLELISEVTSVIDKNKFSMVIVKGNHDVHNNYPERVAPHICKFLSNELQSKL